MEKLDQGVSPAVEVYLACVGVALENLEAGPHTYQASFVLKEILRQIEAAPGGVMAERKSRGLEIPPIEQVHTLHRCLGAAVDFRKVLRGTYRSKKHLSPSSVSKT